MPFPRLEASRDADVVVIGAGIAGAAVALELARSRQRLIVLEAGALCGGSDVGHVRVGLDAPYGEAVSRFGREGAREIWEQHRESRIRLEGLLPLLGPECGYRRAGGFRLVETRAEAQMLAESEDLLREDGFGGEFFDHHMLEARFDVRGFAASYWAADDAELDADALIRGLAAVAEQAGASVHEHSAVVELELSAAGAVALTESGARVRAALAVIAAGAGSVQLVPWLAGRLLVRRERRLRLEVHQSAALPSPGIARGSQLAWRVTAESLLVRGTAAEDFVARRSLGPPGRVREVVSAASAATADDLPLLGGWPGVPAMVACGFAGNSLGIAFQAARWLARAASGRDAVPAPWRADRELSGAGV